MVGIVEVLLFISIYYVGMSLIVRLLNPDQDSDE